MICDNCGAILDEGEEYCPNCGMELLDLPHNPAKKRKYHKNSGSFSRGNVEKPLKKRYIKKLEPESPDYSRYHDSEYDEYDEYESFEKDYKGKSGGNMANIILLLFIALILGFIEGLFMFGSQSIPQIPGFNS